ncbi:Calpain-type cysteine protease DEK1 [Capsicum baccatum]|uniref:Calpain-type cysteine protease DEK1 n=1 Tax=Capsicum baccatum TaxID=33114 RepID=A0A2G2VX30_CAPBA|nr:Calpain-type cysteine protease DEK1 [Capsicum baccatum]
MLCQDEVRLRLFLDNIGFSDLSAKDIKKWLPEDRRRFEIIQESYMREKEMEEEILMQRREEEGRGKERRKALLEEEESKWKEIEASLISSIPNAGNREAAAMASAVRAVGGDSVLDDSFARERVSSIARRIRAAQLSPRALQTGLAGAVCILDDALTTSGRQCGQIDPTVDGWDSDPADVDLYDRDDVDWDGQYSSGRKRRSDRDGVVLDVDSFTRRLRKPRVDMQKEINQHMLSVEIAVKEALLARGESYFTDQEFPPHDRSLFMDPDNPSSKLQVVSEWMRPTDIVKEKHLGNHPCLFSGVANSSDVCQGRLGDCWFLSAVAVLTEVSRISEVIISPEYNQEGIYTVRFCIQKGPLEQHLGSINFLSSKFRIYESIEMNH